MTRRVLPRQVLCAVLAHGLATCRSRYAFAFCARPPTADGPDRHLCAPRDLRFGPPATLDHPFGSPRGARTRTSPIMSASAIAHPPVLMPPRIRLWADGVGRPCPPRGHGAHRSVFILHALSKQLDLRPGTSAGRLREAMRDSGACRGAADGSVRARLTGLYQRA